ncbi:MAG: hypothetical protein P8L44_24335 [Opitutales bacterium]|jgi:hypothetical protein|nr:hypothetical protein [Opitutales bacterium]
MKSLIRIEMLALAALMASMPGLRGQEEENEAKNMANDPLPTIYVEYRENEFYPERSRYNTMNEQDRFYYLKRNFEKVFAKEDWGVNFEFKLYPIDDMEDVEVLEITVLSFDSRNSIEVELRTWTKFRGKGVKEDFGVQSIRHAPSPVFTQGSIERDLNQIYTKLAKDIAKDLNLTIFSNQ